MFRKTKVCVGVLVAFGALTHSAIAQQQAQLERVEVTGSSIKRIANEGALPVQVMTKAEIARTGATSVVDLMKNLAVFQGGLNEATSIGGGGGGSVTISLHNLGADRTLVLLNGRRVVGDAGGPADLNIIPIAALERVEILTDGASAIYGADAVAGVVNFITKRDSTAGDISVGFSYPKSGAEEKRVSLSKGFGDLEKDGFNISVSGSYEKRSQLFAADRDFSKSGILYPQVNGKTYQFVYGSGRGIPGNADMANGFNNYALLTTGKCPERHITTDDTSCTFDFASTVQIYPERERASLLATGTAKVGSALLKVDSLFSKTKSTAKIAPVPGEIRVKADGPFQSYLDKMGYNRADQIEYNNGGPLQAGDVANPDVTVYYRGMDLGPRISKDERDFAGIWGSLEGTLAGWDYNLAASYNETKTRQFNEGYPYDSRFSQLLNSGLWNPFVGPGQQSAAAMTALSSVLIPGSEKYSSDKTTRSTVELRVSRELMQLRGGAMGVGAGVYFANEGYSTDYSALAQGKVPRVDDPSQPDVRFGDANVLTPYSAKRNVTGLYAELVAPVLKELELNAALRGDNFEGSGSSVTGKLSFRFTPFRSLLLRGGVGTGYRAPTLNQLYAPRALAGSTDDGYKCTADLQKLATELGAKCRPDGLQYDVFDGGNADLKPEKSRQATLGFRIEPSSSVTLGADYWWVGIEDTFGSLTQQEAFGAPLQNRSNFSVYKSPTGSYLAFVDQQLNLGKSYTSGLDVDVIFRWTDGPIKFTTNIQGTYMIRDVGQLKINGPYYSSVSDNNANLGTVTFRTKLNIGNTVKMGDWTHAFNVNYLSGYKDAVAGTLYEVDANGVRTGARLKNVRLPVASYLSVDWQTAWAATRSITLVAGAKNLFDAAPPLTLATGGSGKSHAMGYDSRYYDPRGRTFYLNGSYAF
ncbi:iron complex outermembrane receptor protein [Paucibacter oligotrophus]|uniref:Iron complex outermembrane receptor protein n=1 Tax=Roseateles oligotrophus TaxID=1769250 RepID=A0A840L6W9_9BURK|nr:TonB-dependent receptor [Roseateles oligotrophus]MBB4841909.1 iron complex outermembrane receptor protein [Roseateles oligotrophus]